ncbi:unnamed protein product [Durusdinium trenchii]|uniref:Uncharacterized protein n=1 Tax=Durusdinium trenchii TaxID=1381693 RepID=A0ABP0QWC3_9DINO
MATMKQRIAEYASAFAKQKRLREVGFSFLCNATGRLFTKQQVSSSDLDANYDPVYAVMVVSRGTGRYSAHLLKESIMKFYEEVSRFRNLYRHAGTSKKGNINRLKQDLEGKVDSRTSFLDRRTQMMIPKGMVEREVDLESTVPKLPGDSGGHHPDQKIMDLALQLKDARAHAASQKKARDT